MDSSFTVKPPRPGAPALHTPRDPIRVREAAETELEAAKAVASLGDGAGGRGAGHHDNKGDHRPDHPPQDVVVDPASREVIYRERDVRTASTEHPDQALLRERAYRQTPTDADRPAPVESLANIKA